MPLTTLDPRSALMLIDLQKGVVGLPLAHPVGPVVAHSAALAEAFRARGLPVVLVNVSGGAPGRNEAPRMPAMPDGWDELVPELGRRASDHCVTKKTWGAFGVANLNAHLKGLGVTEIVLAGIATSIGVESTARQAHELGYNLALVTDAMTDRSAEAHENSVTRIFPRLGETTTTADILADIAKRACS